MLEVGICGTDKEICSFEYGAPPDDSEFLVLGHESLGRVIEVGPDVSRLKSGDLVIPSVRRPCPHEYCRACRAGRQDFCFTGDFTERGIKQQHGFLAERVVEQQGFLNTVSSKTVFSFAVVPELFPSFLSFATAVKRAAHKKVEIYAFYLQRFHYLLFFCIHQQKDGLNIPNLFFLFAGGFQF